VVVEAEELPFRLLSDERLQVIRATGLAHEEGGPAGETIAIPAQILLRPDGTVAWKFVSSRITERAPPEETLRAIEGL
jgi:peroxiredoxin